MKRYFVTGIGTNVGKTIASAVLTEALRADYWKPIQTGEEMGRDTEIVKSLISNDSTKIFDEIYLLKEAVSPNLAAKLENLTIEWSKLNLPETKNNLIIEGAGGPLVPINDENYVIELAKKFDAEVILVATDYLGCINHTLLAIEYLMANDHKLAGIIFNGEFAPEIEQSICNYKPIHVIGRIPHAETMNKEFIIEQAQKIKL